MAYYTYTEREPECRLFDIPIIAAGALSDALCCQGPKRDFATEQQFRLQNAVAMYPPGYRYDPVHGYSTYAAAPHYDAKPRVVQQRGEREVFCSLPQETYFGQNTFTMHPSTQAIMANESRYLQPFTELTPRSASVVEQKNVRISSEQTGWPQGGTQTVLYPPTRWASPQHQPLPLVVQETALTSSGPLGWSTNVQVVQIGSSQIMAIGFPPETVSPDEVQRRLEGCKQNGSPEKAQKEKDESRLKEATTEPVPSAGAGEKSDEIQYRHDHTRTEQETLEAPKPGLEGENTSLPMRTDSKTPSEAGSKRSSDPREPIIVEEISKSPTCVSTTEERSVVVEAKGEVPAVELSSVSETKDSDDANPRGVVKLQDDAEHQDDTEHQDDDEHPEDTKPPDDAEHQDNDKQKADTEQQGDDKQQEDAEHQDYAEHPNDAEQQGGAKQPAAASLTRRILVAPSPPGAGIVRSLATSHAGLTNHDGWPIGYIPPPDNTYKELVVGDHVYLKGGTFYLSETGAYLLGLRD